LTQSRGIRQLRPWLGLPVCRRISSLLLAHGAYGAGASPKIVEITTSAQWRRRSRLGRPSKARRCIRQRVVSMDAARNGARRRRPAILDQRPTPKCASSRLVHDQFAGASADIMGGVAPVASGAPDTMGELPALRPQDAPGNGKTVSLVVRVPPRNAALLEALSAPFSGDAGVRLGHRGSRLGRVVESSSDRWFSTHVEVAGRSRTRGGLCPARREIRPRKLPLSRSPARLNARLVAQIARGRA